MRRRGGAQSSESKHCAAPHSHDIAVRRAGDSIPTLRVAGMRGQDDGRVEVVEDRHCQGGEKEEGRGPASAPWEEEGGGHSVRF